MLICEHISRDHGQIIQVENMEIGRVKPPQRWMRARTNKVDRISDNMIPTHGMRRIILQLNFICMLLLILGNLDVLLLMEEIAQNADGDTRYLKKEK